MIRRPANQGANKKAPAGNTPANAPAKPLDTTPVIRASPNGDDRVLVTTDLTVIVKGIPTKWRLSGMTIGIATKAVQIAGQLFEVTFDRVVVVGQIVTIPQGDPSVRTATGGYVLQGLYDVKPAI